MDTRQIVQERKHKPEYSLEVLLHEYSAFQTRYQHLWNMRLTWGSGIATIVAAGLVWGLHGGANKVIFAVLPFALTLGVIVGVVLELNLRQDSLYLNHIENKVNRVAGLELLQYYTKYSRALGGMDRKVLSFIPKSTMSILYVVSLLLIGGLWIYLIWLAMAEYITPMFPNWKGVLVLALYIGGPVVPVVLLLLGFKLTNNKFDSINKQDKVWYTNSKIKEPEERIEKLYNKK